jgi:RNA recognition motif-containing protein
MATLFMMNVPYDCTESELAQWVQSYGARVKNVRLIQDLVAGVSPAFAYVDIHDEDIDVPDTIEKLKGHIIRNRVILVSQSRRSAPAA